MILLLFIPPILMILIPWWTSRHREELSGGEGGCICFGLLFTIILLALVIWIPIANGSGLAKRQAFYEANALNYEITVDETAAYLSQEDFVDKLVSGSIEKIEQAGYVSERIKEWRDAVNGYNTAIASMKYYDRNIFTGLLVPNEVQDMKLLVIK